MSTIEVQLAEPVRRSLHARLARAAPSLLSPRSIRMRLTLLYGGLFLLAGTALLGATYLIVVNLPWYPKPGFSSPSFRAALGSRPQPRYVAGLIELADSRNTALHALLVRSAFALIAVAVVSMFLGWVVAGRALRPLREITETTRAISEDNLHERLALEGPKDEVRQLGDTIDGLLGRLEGAFEAQRNFVTNASHELRTPLAMMRTSVDVAVAKPHVSDDAAVLAAKLREGLDQSERLLESFLVLAKSQRGVMTDVDAVRLGELVEDALEANTNRVAARRLDVRTRLDDLAVVGSRTLLSRLVGNLVDNAIAYNEDAGVLVVTLESDRAVARLTVENSGRAIERDRVAQLVQPFRRLGADRTNQDSGIGLGLTIVREIASAHGGCLALDARDGGGVRAVVELPLAAQTRTGFTRSA